MALDVNSNLSAFTGQSALSHRGLYGGYLTFQQQVSENLSLFLNAVFADKRTSVTDHQVAAGLVYKGLFDSRPEDDIGLAVGTTHVNSRAFAPNNPGGSEYAAELYYTYRPTNGLLVRPNLQYIHHPG